MARQIGTLGRALYAAPSYAQAHGLPAAVGDLAAQRLVTNNTVPSLNDWPFVVDGAPQRFAAQGQWRANDTGMAAAMVLEGLGIGRLATLVGMCWQSRGCWCRCWPGSWTCNRCLPMR